MPNTMIHIHKLSSMVSILKQLSDGRSGVDNIFSFSVTTKYKNFLKLL